MKIATVLLFILLAIQWYSVESLLGLLLLKHVAFHHPFYYSYGHYPSYGHGRTYRGYSSHYHHRIHKRNNEGIDDDLRNPSLGLTEIFDVIAKNDKDTCLQKMVCEVGVSPHEYNIELSRVFDNNIDGGESFQKYHEAYDIGVTGLSLNLCAQNFPSCTLTSEELKYLAES
ncbi:uncharacterized protein LOC111088735 [Limulus polyphemus]|uniref:Uncharacterized protein LOC111088735 n=1 Tax=Limulus polyphemus TaxID=6850 RepID=A0ABM1THG0_LIMPO|nr:uncharacterized protein LOC111088735 [Limulus polyphemus]XP_022255316.1 uncharacterized protein LOC111088735 [Limulus polyphemus]